MNLFQVLLDPGREELEAGDRAPVSQAANILQIGEFQLLQLAYREWHGVDLPEALVSRLFASYMFHGKVPYWARHYARLILVRNEQGLLDPDDPRYHRFDHGYATTVPKGVRHFLLAVLAITFTLAAGLLLASLATTSPTSRLPPYFGKEELPAAVGPRAEAGAMPGLQV
jgi:hypothetical protein